MGARPDRIAAPPSKRLARVLVERPRPDVDGGRYPVKRTPGEPVHASVDVIRDGHEVLRAVLRFRGPGERRWSEVPMVAVDAERAGVRWAASFVPERMGAWQWTVEAWADALASWRHEVDRKVEAGQDDLSSELAEGALLLRATASRAKGDDRALVDKAATIVGDESASTGERVEAALDATVVAACERWPDRTGAGALAAPQDVVVGSPLGRFGAWYELFPRSWGGLDGVRRRLPALAELGFDVIYLPPIHPIGVKNRKGRNNALVAGDGDPGSPWAIGSPEGGHTAVHPDLGSQDDLDRLVREARELGMEIALDLAIQCSADHPWLTEHPEWFSHRPDGTLKYAENPPKKYQDIYNVDFDCEDWRGLWSALLDVVRHWVDHGVRVFRVDNPHTKPLRFWEWLIDAVHTDHPEVVFLAEAFTKRAMMQALAKVGFDQSYTYFTWKSARWELEEYVGELAHSGEQEYFRPNFFVNTPDILTEELVLGGPAAFTSRLVLAATLSPSYGVYSGFEHFEATPVRPGSEEYLDSEKYEAKARTLDGPLLPLVAHLNGIRRANRALQHVDGITFCDTRNDGLIAYAKQAPGNTVICVVCLDAGHAQEGLVEVPDTLGLPPTFAVTDLLTGERFTWRVGGNYVRLVPGPRPAHILRVEEA
ncbi:MAG: alpha-1,4-glucan--maltose-1-phosphate maltosyltransferase [Actinobacteria bacterium]|nr:alpha-1,4-glucan--maltose-1-phosphate maltosyltransferase [Actinomycetota bacterium]